MISKLFWHYKSVWSRMTSLIILFSLLKCRVIACPCLHLLRELGTIFPSVTAPGEELSILKRFLLFGHYLDLYKSFYRLPC